MSFLNYLRQRVRRDKGLIMPPHPTSCERWSMAEVLAWESLDEEMNSVADMVINEMSNVEIIQRREDYEETY